MLPRSTHSSTDISLSSPLISSSLKFSNCSLINTASVLWNHLPKKSLPGRSSCSLTCHSQPPPLAICRTAFIWVCKWNLSSFPIPGFRSSTYQWWPSSTIFNVAPFRLFSLTSPTFWSGTKTDQAPTWLLQIWSDLVLVNKFVSLTWLLCDTEQSFRLTLIH